MKTSKFFVLIALICLISIGAITSCKEKTAQEKKESIVEDIDEGMDSLFYWPNLANEITGNGMFVMKGGVDTTINGHKIQMAIIHSKNEFADPHMLLTQNISLLNLKYTNSDGIDLFTIIEPWKEEVAKIKNKDVTFNTALYRIPSTNIAILMVDNPYMIAICEVHNYFNKKDFDLNLKFILDNFDK